MVNHRFGFSRRRALVTSVAIVLTGCAGTPEVVIPEPRRVVNHEGVRIRADRERMAEIWDWVNRAETTVREDPSFVLSHSFVPEPRYPWETMELVPGDTVRIAYERSAPDTQTSYWMYAFLHLMREMNRLVAWFPETETMEGWELERFIVGRTADSWLLGRSSFDTHPYRLLDHLIYAQDAQMLDAFLLHLRGEEFPEAREAFLSENPDGFDELARWWRETWGEELPEGR